MRTATLDVRAVRARFSALQRPLAFFDGPGGTQCPDEVIEAISPTCASRTRTSGRRTRRRGARTSWSASPEARAASFLGCTPEEVAFGPSMTALNFLLARVCTDAPRRRRVVVTTLDHDANVSPWLELAHDLGILVRVAGVTDVLELDYDDLAAQLTARTRVVAFPVAANSVGTAPDVRQVVELAHAVGARLGGRRALRAARADRRRGLRRRRAHLLAVQVLRTAHGARVRQAGAARVVAPVQSAARGERAGRSTASSSAPRSTSCWPASSPRSTTSARSAGTPSPPTSTRSASGSAGHPGRVELYGLRTMDGRVPTFCFNVPGSTPATVATLLAERDLAVWHGDYYAVEVMKHLGLVGGAVRAGIVHYNTEDEVDRLLRPCRPDVKLVLLGGPRFLGRAVADAALARGHELTFFNRGRTSPELSRPRSCTATG